MGQTSRLGHGGFGSPAVDGAHASRSPARTAMSSRFAGGASGQAHFGSKAQDGWNAKLKSRTSVPATRSPPRSALFAASRRYRPAPYVSAPLVASRNGRKSPPA